MKQELKDEIKEIISIFYNWKYICNILWFWYCGAFE